MELPAFLLADNTDEPDALYVIHTQYPRFAWDLQHDEVEWFDQLEGTEEDLIDEVGRLMETAQAFYEREMRRHEAEVS